jgi:hypothetical protein
MESGSWRRGLTLDHERVFVPVDKTSDSGEANSGGNEHGPVEMFRGLVSGHARQSAASEVVPRAAPRAVNGSPLEKADQPAFFMP